MDTILCICDACHIHGANLTTEHSFWRVNSIKSLAHWGYKLPPMFVSLVVRISAVSCLEKLVSKMTCHVLSGTLSVSGGTKLFDASC